MAATIAADPDAEPKGLTGDRQDLVVANLGLAHWCVRRFVPWLAVHGPDYEDATGAAFLGLVKAAHRFDPGGEAAFTTFAVRACWWQITAWRRDHSSRSIGGDARPRPEKPGAPVREALAAGVAERGIGVDPVAVRAAVEKLPPRLREAVRLLFWENLTLREAGARLGVCAERARQLRAQAVEQLRWYFRAETR